jgi:hypothetical protein
MDSLEFSEEAAYIAFSELLRGADLCTISGHLMLRTI